MRSVAEIEKELQQAKAAEAEKAKLAEIEKRKLEKQAEAERTTAYMRELHTRLIAAGVAATLRESSIGEYSSLRLAAIDIEDVHWSVELDRRGSGYSSDKSYQINVGRYGDRKVYPRLKTDTFKYDAIVEDVKARVENAKRESELSQSRAQNRDASQKIVDALRAEFKLPEYRLIAPCETDGEKVKFELKTQVTEAQARALIQAMREAGIES